MRDAGGKLPLTPSTDTLCDEGAPLPIIPVSTQEVLLLASRRRASNGLKLIHELKLLHTWHGAKRDWEKGAQSLADRRGPLDLSDKALSTHAVRVAWHTLYS